MCEAYDHAYNILACKCQRQMDTFMDLDGGPLSVLLSGAVSNCELRALSRVQSPDLCCQESEVVSSHVQSCQVFQPFQSELTNLAI